MKRTIFLLAAALVAVCAGQAQTIRYSEYGAVGDGVTDDFAAIVKAHDAANKKGVPVQADAGATYYIGGGDKPAQIQTDTDWRDAKFIIDDRNVKKRGSQIFVVSSKLPATKITHIGTLRKNQEKINLSLKQRSLVSVTDNSTKRYKRSGRNQNPGSSQTDVFIVDRNGRVDASTPIIWDFDSISSMTAYPIDPTTLTVKGGHFTTIATQTTENDYYARNISIRRSNVVIDGLQHAITGEKTEGDGAPYTGFISVGNCADVTVQNCTLTGRRYYNRGSYDISAVRAVNVTFRNCRQFNDAHDKTFWGILGSNFCKNLVFDNVEFSRFDAHQGVTNATIKNSVLGHQGVNLIGFGTFLIENTKVCGRRFINLRNDYGSTFDGEVIIRNCEFIPSNGNISDATIISGSYSGQHDYGYTCYMPRRITIDGLVIHDTNPVEGYQGPKLFADFNSKYTSEAYTEKYPYVITEEVIIKNMTIKSGKPYIVSSNPYMFRNVKITEK